MLTPSGLWTSREEASHRGPMGQAKALGSYCSENSRRNSQRIRGRGLGRKKSEILAERKGWKERRATTDHQPTRQEMTDTFTFGCGVPIRSHTEVPRWCSQVREPVPYLIPVVGGAPPESSCCHPRSGFCKPAAGTGPWLSCRLESPPLCWSHLH